MTKKIPTLVTLLPKFKSRLEKLAKEKGLSLGSYIEFMLDELEKKNA